MAKTVGRPKGSVENFNVTMDIGSKRDTVSRIGIYNEVLQIRYDVGSTIDKLTVILDKLDDMVDKAYRPRSGSR